MRTIKPLDKRRQYYLVLDCETATLSCANKYNAEQKKKIAIAKTLSYDLAWQIIDKSGKVYRKRAYLITEIFSVPEIFNTAYYASKRPIYIEKLQKGEIELTSWTSATNVLVQDESTGEIKKRDTDNLLEDIGGYSCTESAGLHHSDTG